MMEKEFGYYVSKTGNLIRYCPCCKFFEVVTGYFWDEYLEEVIETTQPF